MDPLFTKLLIKYKQNSLRIVYYHMISNVKPDYYFNNKGISLKLFKSQISFYKSHYEIISLEKALSLAKKNICLKNKLVITFDDGFVENYSIVAPILLSEKITATFFFTTNCIDNKDLMWRNKLVVIQKHILESHISKINKFSDLFNVINLNFNDSLLEWSKNHWPMSIKEVFVNKIWDIVMPYTLTHYLKENKPYCSSAQIKELSNLGFSIGSHSLSHPMFNKLDYESFSNEIISSSLILSKIINKEVKLFSYPFGERSIKLHEEKFLKLNKSNWIFLGTKNYLNNFSNNYNFWERDNVEFNNFFMKLRFAYFPIIRSFIK